MKKTIIAIVGALAVFTSGAGSVYADQPKLTASVNEVVGTPYKWGGTTTDGFDCSGFILHIFKQFDVKLPRTSKTQANTGEKVEKDDLRPGDLVFFNTDGKGISHAGIYVGDGNFAHSSSSKGVRISGLSDSYYKKRYVTARRVVSEQVYKSMMNSIH
ncbi:C40 family peptidase [Paenibacillus spongiae]|uniref:C40 family peptidase n=1 Tax=Paenibacillus spongiae TaxID=2909671 RepID=A0ABY5SB23_9BACL|nr:C40 family peptidase [Paenibacillus spongiae]UVI31146.1 C40 family peptidase [Paenibacillus spongiae]